MAFKEGEIFYTGNYSWRIDHLIDVPATIQTLLYLGQRIVGRWLFKPGTPLKKIKVFMGKSIIEFQQKYKNG